MAATNGIAELTARGVIAVTGDDRRVFLQGLITNDIDRLSTDNPLYAALLTPQGKYLHDFFLVENGERILIDCEAERRADLIRRLTLYKLRAKAEITDFTDSLGVIAWWGEDVPPTLPADAVAYADPRYSALGRRVILRQDEMPRPLGEQADYDDHRLVFGVPEGSRDFEVDRSLILEGNLDALNGVSFTKGCYVGQELTARTKHRGKVRKRLLPVDVEGPLPAPDTPVMKGDREIGQLRSGRGCRAMAVLRVEDIEIGAHYACGDAHVIPQRPEWLPAEWLGPSSGSEQA